MGKFIFIPASSYQDDPVIRLKDGEKGVVNSVLMHKKGDTIYYNGSKHPGKYDIFEISKDSLYVKSLSCKFPVDDRLRGLYDMHLNALSELTKIPIDELKEIKNLERMARVPKPIEEE